jgi:hypothetical protein
MSTETENSLILEKYLNKCDIQLTGHIQTFRSAAIDDPVQRQYLDLTANALANFQSKVIPTQRALLHVTRTSGGLISFRSTYRFREDTVVDPFATLEFDPSPTTRVRTFTDIGTPHALTDAIHDRDHLSLTYLLQPVRTLLRSLRRTGWKTYADAIAGDKVITGLTDGNVALYVIVDLTQFEADTAAIKEYHASKEPTHERSA